MKRAEAGFTLIELLVALSIFAMLSAAGVLLLGNAVSAQGAIQRNLEAQGDLLRVVALLDADMAQALPRISRTESGLLAPAFFSRAPSNDEPFLQFVRGGWTNMDDAPRSDLQKVEYWLRDGKLERRTYPMVDGAEGGEPAMLIDGVDSLALSFRDARGVWRDEWQQSRAQAMPIAMRMVIGRKAHAPLTLLVRVGAGEIDLSGKEDADG
ncbi:MAG: type II secretion system protein GspJ [Sphingomonadales bacterium]|nr:MAG: type II secretion system protein GspJ [Sphingomonadales bacterium]TNF03865.1 MAG: type II secretion system protein GspJ [Sphingomonadales bacterium]